MSNVAMKVTDNVLHIAVDLTQSQGMSSSGKNETIATTSGNTALAGEGVPDGCKVGVNVYCKERKVAKVETKAPAAAPAMAKGAKVQGR